MGKSTSVQIGSLAFGSKKDAKQYVRRIFDKYDDYEPIQGEDDAFLRDLVSLHSESEAKIGLGINHFTIELDQHWRSSRNFMIHREDGSSTDFSFHTCIDGNRARRDAFEAMRTAVADQIISFKIAAYSGGVVPVCPYRKCQIPESRAHVDHEAPNTFLVLANAWMELNGYTFEHLALVDNADNQWIRSLRDQDHIRSWQDFHRANARLRIISKIANLSDAKASRP